MAQQSYSSDVQQNLQREIFQRQQAESSVRILEAAMMSSLNPICISNLDLELLFANCAFADLFSIDPVERAYGHGLSSFLGDDSALTDLFSSLWEKHNCVCEFLCCKGTPRERVIKISANLAHDDQGHPSVFIFSFEDISVRKKSEKILQDYHDRLEETVNQRTAELEKINTDLKTEIAERLRIEDERKRMENDLRQAQKLESLGTLAGGIAHEINTPTQYVGDNLRFLQDSFGDVAETLSALLQKAQANTDEANTDDMAYLLEEIPTAIQQSLDGVERISNIVLAVKQFSYPHTGEKTAVNLNACIKTTVEVARNQWKYVAELVLDLQSDLPLVPCMPGELNQVILNLVVNAAHAIEDTAKDDALGTALGTITVRTRVVDTHVEIDVEDTGPGVPDDIRDRMFDPFFTTKAPGKGTGQGLAICHTIVRKKHGGQIRVGRGAEGGALFTISLPLTDTAQKDTS